MQLNFKILKEARLPVIHFAVECLTNCRELIQYNKRKISPSDFRDTSMEGWEGTLLQKQEVASLLLTRLHKQSI